MSSQFALLLIVILSPRCWFCGFLEREMRALQNFQISYQQHAWLNEKTKQKQIKPQTPPHKPMCYFELVKEGTPKASTPTLQIWKCIFSPGCLILSLRMHLLELDSENEINEKYWPGALWLYQDSL